MNVYIKRKNPKVLTVICALSVPINHKKHEGDPTEQRQSQNRHQKASLPPLLWPVFTHQRSPGLPVSSHLHHRLFTFQKWSNLDENTQQPEIFNFASTFSFLPCLFFLDAFCRLQVTVVRAFPGAVVCFFPHVRVWSIPFGVPWIIHLIGIDFADALQGCMSGVGIVTLFANILLRSCNKHFTFFGWLSKQRRFGVLILDHVWFKPDSLCSWFSITIKYVFAFTSNFKSCVSDVCWIWYGTCDALDVRFICGSTSMSRKTLVSLGLSQSFLINTGYMTSQLI